MGEFRRKLGDFDVLLTDTASEDLRQAVHQQIRAFNDERSAQHWMVRKAGKRPLDIFLHDSEGRLRGGLVASTYWGWLEIDDLWLDEALRGRGYGRRLMALVETEARARGCRQAWVRTFRFQARGF
jgi:GNAT superfamily N-acetyltransferase